MSTFPPKDSDPLPYYTKVPYWTHFAEKERELNNQTEEAKLHTKITNLLAILREKRAEMEVERDTLTRRIQATTLVIDYLDCAP